MLSAIKKVLKETPGLTGREIARKLKKEKKEVNSYLSRNSKGLYQQEYKWFLESTDTIEWEIKCSSWFTCEAFEESYLDIGNILDAEESNIIIRLPNDFKVLLIAGARLIALINYLNHVGKCVTLDFQLCTRSMDYLNRLGFFDHIHKNIDIFPERPKTSKAKKYKGTNKNLVEIGDIDLENFNDDLPKELTAAFTHHAGEEYRMAAFTVFSELIGNVEEHSESPIPGFAALQLYNGIQRHIQTVISDHGLGLSNTLKANLPKYYPKLASSMDLACVTSDIDLIIKALTDGKLSRFGHDPEGDARGLGLKRSQTYALKYNAEITIRQGNFLVKLVYKKGSLVDSSYKDNLGLMPGTHVCFDFIFN